MRRDVAISSAVLVACASVAAGGNTRFIMEVSGDGGATWHRSMSVAPGTEVKARLSAEYAGAEQVLGLGGFNVAFQLRGWNAATDVLSPWDTPTVQRTGLAAGVTPGQYGRQQPFAAVGSAWLPETAVFDTRLWIGGRTAGRIPIGQGPSAYSQEYFNPSLRPCVFMLAFTPTNPTGVVRNLEISAYDIFNSVPDAATWYTDVGSAAIRALQLPSDAPLRTASVIVTPAPGAVGLLAVFGAAALRRRRVSRGACIGRECRHISLALSHSFSGDQL